jgi:hypothetical protein
MAFDMSRHHVYHPTQQEILDVRKLYDRVQFVEQGAGFQVPSLNNDPTTLSGTNAWVLTDGRLRVQTPNGTIHEYATVTPGSGTSGTPFTAPVVVTNHTANIYPISAGWVQNYVKNGAQKRVYPNDNSLAIGSYTNLGGITAYNGLGSAILYFPNLHTTLAGSIFNWAYLHGKVFSTKSPGGTDVQIGGGVYTAIPPNSYTSSFENRTQGHIPPPTIKRTTKTLYHGKHIKKDRYKVTKSTKEEGRYRIALSSYIRGQLLNNLINGLTIKARNSNQDSYCVLDVASIYLRVNYTK